MTPSTQEHKPRSDSCWSRRGHPELLPLIFDYPVEWDEFKVLQNFYDTVGHENWNQRFSHRVEDGQLILY